MIIDDLSQEKYSGESGERGERYGIAQIDALFTSLERVREWVDHHDHEDKEVVGDVSNRLAEYFDEIVDKARKANEEGLDFEVFRDEVKDKFQSYFSILSYFEFEIKEGEKEADLPATKDREVAAKIVEGLEIKDDVRHLNPLGLISEDHSGSLYEGAWHDIVLSVRNNLKGEDSSIPRQSDLLLRLSDGFLKEIFEKSDIKNS